MEEEAFALVQPQYLEHWDASHIFVLYTCAIHTFLLWDQLYHGLSTPHANHIDVLRIWVSATWKFTLRSSISVFPIIQSIFQDS